MAESPGALARAPKSRRCKPSETAFQPASSPPCSGSVWWRRCWLRPRSSPWRGCRQRTKDLQRASIQAVYAERINTLIAMVVMDTRGIYSARNAGRIKYFVDGILRHLSGIEATMTAWLAIAEPRERRAGDRS